MKRGKIKLLSILIAFALVLSLLPMTAFAEGESYTISYELKDSYGDGWNGNAIKIYDATSDAELTSLTFDDGHSASGTVELVTGHNYQFIWITGSYTSETTFVIKDADGKTLCKSGGSDLSDGYIFMEYVPGEEPVVHCSYPLWIGNDRVRGDLTEGSGWTFDLASGTLTLSNPQPEYLYQNALITAAMDVTISGAVTASYTDYYTVKAIQFGEAAAVTVKGDISAEADETAYGILGVYEGSIDVTGNVSADAYRGIGISLSPYYYGGGSPIISESGDSDGESDDTAKLEANVTGSVEASGVHAQGVAVSSYGNGYEMDVTVGDGITATAEGEGGTFSCSAGIYAMNYGSTIAAEVTGDITASQADGFAYGIEIMGMMGSSGCPVGSQGSNEVLVYGNVVADGYGIYYMGETDTSILVEDTIDAGIIGVMFMGFDYDYPEAELTPADDLDGETEEDSLENLDLTVWRILLNDKGDVAGRLNMDGFYYPSVKSTEDMEQALESPIVGAEADVEYEAAPDYEETIKYIVKVEQPAEGGEIYATDASGNALETSYDYDIAYEGDKVILQTDKIEAGYVVKAAYNGEEKVALEKDADGKYYLNVPKGGGVLLSVELEKTDNPPTGDSSHMGLWVILLCAAGTAFVTLMFSLRKKGKNN